MISRWTPNHHLLEADPQTVLQGHCDCKPITVRTAEMSRQEKDAARSSEGNSDQCTRHCFAIRRICGAVRREKIEERQRNEGVSATVVHNAPVSVGAQLCDRLLFGKEGEKMRMLRVAEVEKPLLRGTIASLWGLAAVLQMQRGIWRFRTPQVLSRIRSCQF